MANFNFNKVILGGRLTADPELKTTPSGISVTSFNIAVNRRFSGKNGEEAQADFFEVTAWRQTAEFITRYFRKASSICVLGSLESRSWVDQNGQKRYAIGITADEAYFVDAKSEAPAAVQTMAAAQTNSAVPGGQYVPQGYMAPENSGTQPYVAPGNAPKFEELSADDEIPF